MNMENAGKESDVKKNMKVSVIIPVYNVERYILRCIESLKRQSISNLEFIFLDDCSTDDSMKAVQEWSEEDDRVHIFWNHENLGTGITRNRGIDAARGEYLSFIDPDDYVSDDFFELLYAAATADGGHCVAKGLRVEVDANGDESRAYGEMLNRMLGPMYQNRPLYRKFSGDHCTALYRRSLFEDGSVRYGKTKVGEDTTFTLRVGLHTEDIVLEPRAEYFYCKREGSAKNTSAVCRFYEELAGLDEKIEALVDKGIDSDACTYIADKLRYYVSHYRAAARFGNHLHDEYIHYWKTIENMISRLPMWHHILEINPYVNSLYKSVRSTAPGLRFGNEGRVRVSVILPLFNPGPFIDRCIESLEQQLLDGLEFIFVDDCSTDGSADKAEAWAKRDARVKILKNDENLGPGASRNLGIQAAKGDYLSFIDPDDYVSPEFFELLYAAATADSGHSIAKGCCCKIDPAENATGMVDYKLNKRILEYRKRGIPLFRGFTYEHQTALYHSRLFKDEGAKYGLSRKDQGYETFLLSACIHTEDIVFCPQALYYYVQREGSIVHTFSSRRFFDELDSFEEKRSILTKRGIDEDALQYLAVKLRVYLGNYENAAKRYHVPEADREAYYRRVNSILSAIDRSDRIKELANMNIDGPGKVQEVDKKKRQLTPSFLLKGNSIGQYVKRLLHRIFL